MKTSFRVNRPRKGERCDLPIPSNRSEASTLEDFLGEVCYGCGKEKRSKMSHCSKCYYRLPRRMQSDLYKRFGEGYEEAFEASKKFLDDLRPPPVPKTGDLF